MKEYPYRIWIEDDFGAERLGATVYAASKVEARSKADKMSLGKIRCVEGTVPEETEAIRRFKAGEKPTYSTGICGSTTRGYGKLDYCGYFEFPLCPEEYDPDSYYEETISFVGQKCSI
jgi:hypothetical protein